LKKYLALGQVHAEHAAIGTKLKVEYTVEFERRELTATVVKRPFFDPERKTFTPNAQPKGGA
jgi:glycine cleavage system aminomethyltransferase T